MIEEAYKTAEESAGSAMREQEHFSESVQFSLNKLQSSVEELSATLINSDFLKWLADLGTTGVEGVTALVKEFGALNTVISSIAGIGLSAAGLD